MSSSYCPLRTFVSLAVWNVNKKGDWGQRAASGFMTHSLINERKGVKARSSLERVCRLTTLNQHARKIYLPRHETNYNQESWASRSPECNTLQWMGLKICSVNGETLCCLSVNISHKSTFQMFSPTREMQLVILFTIAYKTKSGFEFFLCWLTLKRRRRRRRSRKRRKEKERSEEIVCNGSNWGYLVCHSLSKKEVEF